MKVTGKQLQLFADNKWEEDFVHPQLPDFEFDSDTDSGKFDSEKGAMYDYHLSLYNTKTKEYYTAIGGYYNSGCGEQYYNYDVDFELHRDVVEVENKGKKKYITVSLDIEVLLDTEAVELTHDEIEKIIKAELPKSMKVKNFNF